MCHVSGICIPGEPFETDDLQNHILNIKINLWYFLHPQMLFWYDRFTKPSFKHIMNFCVLAIPASVATSAVHRDHFVYVSNQWEVTLQCNVVSHWLGTLEEWSLGIHNPRRHISHRYAGKLLGPISQRVNELVIQILKNWWCLYLKIMFCLGHNCANVMTAELSWQVHIRDLIEW